MPPARNTKVSGHACRMNEIDAQGGGPRRRLTGHQPDTGNVMSQQPNKHSVRRIVLPSGRTIDVVRFGGPEPPTPPTGLHVCPQCICELVQPVSWAEAAQGQWELALSCPNCWWSGEGVFGEKEVHELEDQLDRGLEDM